MLSKGLPGFFLKITNSFRKKLLLCFALIITVLVFTSLYTYYSGKQLNYVYNGILEKRTMLDSLFLNLTTTNDLLEKYQQTGSSEVLDKFDKSYPLLFMYSEDLETRISNTESKRIITDLKYMIQSYVEEASSSTVYLKENKRKESYDHYYNARKIYKLINGSFSDTSSALEKDTLESKKKIEDNRISLVNAILILLTTVFCIIFVQWFSSSVTKHVKSLTRAARKISDGVLDIEEVRCKTNDETGILAEAFNTMVKRIHSQIAEINEKHDIEKKLKDEEMKNLKMKNRNREMEFRSLQARINPHFMFNTLNMITQMAYIEEAPKTVSLLEAMNELLRYNLDKFGKVVTIREDIANLKDYIFIQKMRFSERIRFETFEDDNAMEGLIPCLILQPLVENSIIHGVKKYTKGALVRVDINRNEDRVRISIFDNGIGMDKDRIEAVDSIMKNGPESDDSGKIGLRNVISRLKLFYNNDMEFYITSEIGVGTEIVINLPFLTKEVNPSCTV